MSETDWSVERFAGSAGSFHEREVPVPAPRSLWWFEVERTAVVLGSTQPAEAIDHVAAEAAGIEVARRRSGGGAVLLVPGDTTWIDVLLPADDPRWTADVGRSFHWLGHAWARVLADLGHPGATVHAGPLVRTEWSDLVCFAGLGPGEVTFGGAKAVGISQRRTRHAARFQCALVHRWDPAPLLDVLDLSAAARERAAIELAGAGAPIGGVDPAAVVDRLRSVIAAG